MQMVQLYQEALQDLLVAGPSPVQLRDDPELVCLRPYASPMPPP